MSRYSSYITKPPSQWQQQLHELNSTRLFLVSTLGPTVFILKGDDMTDSTFKVFIGERQMCSCGGGEGRGKLCNHLLFVMIKVLRVPTDNPIAWQLSLVDSEIDSILSGEVHSCLATITNRSTHKFLKKGEGFMMRSNRKVLNSSGDGKSGDCIDDHLQKGNEGTKPTARKDIEEDNVCCICQEEFTSSELENDMLCFCESQCGTNFHKKCFRMYAAYNRSAKKAIAW